MVFSRYDFPRSMIPIERPGMGTTELLEIIFTSTLLTDEDLKAAGYKTRPWKQEGGAFPYAMKKVDNAIAILGDADFSVIIYCPEAYTRSMVDLPAFKIFDVEFNPPPTEKPSAVPDGADNDSVGPLPAELAESDERSTSRPIKPLPKRARGITEAPATVPTLAIAPVLPIENLQRTVASVGTSSARPLLKRKHSGDDNSAPSSQWPLLTPIMASIFSAFGWDPASKVTKPTVEEDKDNENCRPPKRLTLIRNRYSRGK